MSNQHERRFAAHYEREHGTAPRFFDADWFGGPHPEAGTGTPHIHHDADGTVYAEVYSDGTVCVLDLRMRDVEDNDDIFRGGWRPVGKWEVTRFAASEVQRLRGMLAECFRLSGADPDGNEDWRLAESAVEEVRRLRAESDDDSDYARVVKDLSKMRERADALQREVEGLRKGVLGACKTKQKFQSLCDSRLNRIRKLEADLEIAIQPRNTTISPYLWCSGPGCPGKHSGRCVEHDLRSKS